MGIHNMWYLILAVVLAIAAALEPDFVAEPPAFPRVECCPCGPEYAKGDDGSGSAIDASVAQLLQVGEKTAWPSPGKMLKAVVKAVVNVVKAVVSVAAASFTKLAKLFRPSRDMSKKLYPPSARLTVTPRGPISPEYESAEATWTSKPPSNTPGKRGLGKEGSDLLKEQGKCCKCPNPTKNGKDIHLVRPDRHDKGNGLRKYD